jgi:hypothetical protein
VIVIILINKVRLIQVFYKKLTVTYDIIPFLALLSSSIILANNIVSNLYYTVVHLRTKRRVSVMGLQVNQEKIFNSSVKKDKSVSQIDKVYLRYST